MQKVKIRPRRRYFATVCTAFALLWVLGGTLHYLSNRTQRRSLERRLDLLEKQLKTLPRDMPAVPEASPLEQPKEEPQPVKPKYRLLGSGRCGSYRYLDVRFPDKTEFRYYYRTNSPQEKLQVLLRVPQDALDHAEEL